MPRFLFGTCSHLLLLLVLTVGAPGGAWGEVIAYRFTGTIEDIVVAPQLAHFPWLRSGAPVAGFVRWETDPVDSNGDPEIGAYFSPAGALHLEIGDDPNTGHVSSTRGLDLGVKYDPGGGISSTFSLEARFPLNGIGGSVPSSIDKVVLEFERPSPGDTIPIALLPGGENSFVIDLFHYGAEFVPFQARGTITSLTRIEGDYRWNGTASGDWNEPGNWVGNAEPNQGGAKAVLGGDGVGETIITWTAPVLLTDLKVESLTRTSPS